MREQLQENTKKLLKSLIERKYYANKDVAVSVVGQLFAVGMVTAEAMGELCTLAETSYDSNEEDTVTTE